MDVVGKKVENQVQFWSLLGPLLVLLSITVLLFKVSTHWYFPVSALIGIPLCMKWKMKGLAFALLSLLVFSGISYQNLELDERYWHVGLSLTLAFAFIVLALSLEEAEGIINKLQLESQSRLDNFSLLDEKWKIAEQEWVFEREKVKNETLALSKEFAKTKEDKQTFYKLAQLAKDELIQVRDQHQQLLQDLLYKKQQIAQLHERLEETELTIQDFVNSDAEKQIAFLTEKLTSLEVEKEYVKSKLVATQAEEIQWQQEKNVLTQELQTIQEKEKRYLVDQQHFQQNKIEQQNVLQALQNKCISLEQEKETIIQAQNGIQQQIEQFRHSEFQQRLTLQQNQQKTKEIECQLIEQKQHVQDLQKIQAEIEEQLLIKERQQQDHQRSLKQIESNYESKLLQQETQNQQKINELESQITQQKIHAQDLHKAKAEFEEELIIKTQQLKQQQQEADHYLEKIENEHESQLLQQKAQNQKQENEHQAALQAIKHQLEESLIQKENEIKELQQANQQSLESFKQESQEKVLQQVQIHQEEIQKLKNQLKIESEQAELDLLIAQEQFDKEATQQKIAAEQELGALQTKYNQDRNQLAQFEKELKINQEALQEDQKTIDDLHQELKQKENSYQQSIYELEELKQFKEQLENELAALRKQTDSNRPENKKNHSEKPLHSSARAEAMYLQLKQQFQEKCQVLDATRRELFHTNEKLLQCFKEQEEEKQFGITQHEEILQKHLFELTQQYEQKLHQDQQEIEELNQLIKYLVS